MTVPSFSVRDESIFRSALMDCANFSATAFDLEVNWNFMVIIFSKGVYTRFAKYGTNYASRITLRA